MIWKVSVRPEVEEDIAKAAEWYEKRQAGLGGDFIDEIIQVWDSLATNPFLNSRRHSTKNIRWRYPQRFPYRIVYEVREADETILIAAKHERHWLTCV